MRTLRSFAVAALGALAAVVLLSPTAAAAGADSPSRALRTQLPIVTINSDPKIADRRKVTARMRIIDGRGLNRVADRARVYDGQIGIELRGSSSLLLPKKQYGLETRERGGDERDVRLLGLPKEDDWVLHAPFNDKSLLRNAAAYTFSRMLGRYASRTRFVEVVLNGRYQGVYVLMEKLELGSKRVDVDDGAGVEAFLVERTTEIKVKATDHIFRLPVSGLPVIWSDPERSDLSASEADGIKGYVSDFERALYADAFLDPVHGYGRFLDVAAAVDYVLVVELFKTRDGFDNSFYMHRGAGTLLRFGPVWDFDWSSGISPPPEVHTDPEGWIGAGRPWSERLYADPAFMRRVADRWRELRAQGCSSDSTERSNDTRATFAGPRPATFGAGGTPATSSPR